MITLGQRIRELRQEQGLTMQALAQRSNMSIAAISLIERSLRPDPRYSTLCAISRGLEVPLIEIIDNHPQERQ